MLLLHFFSIFHIVSKYKYVSYKDIWQIHLFIRWICFYG
nr:MAG TPA: hypothetical protein [Caudoviricetes sp.]